MKRIIYTALTAVGFMLATGCTTVPPGYVGIKVDNWGENRGVQDYPIRTGRVGYNPVHEDVHLFPTHQRTVKWEFAKNDEGQVSGQGKAITFNSGMDRVPITAEVGLSVAAKATRVPHIFVKYRLDLDSIIDGPVRNEVKATLGAVAEGFSASDIVAGKQSEFLSQVKLKLGGCAKCEQVSFGILGEDFDIDSIGFLSAPRIPENILNAINESNAAAQLAQKAQYLVAVKKAEADQAIEQARGQAEAIKIQADAQAYAQQKIAASTTPLIVELKKIEKWNGQLPTVSGGSTPLVSLK